MAAPSAKKTVSRIAKALYRRAPERVRKSIKSTVLDALPSSVGQTVTQKQKLSPDAARISITPTDVGKTYDPSIVLPMLALENNTLQRLLQESERENNNLRGILRSQQQNLQFQEVDKSAAQLAETYLASQPNAKVRHLLIANEYPRKGKEYGNGFVHQRVKQYIKAGIAVDVVCAGFSVEQDMFEYDGVRVLTGHGSEIKEVLKRQKYDSVSVHFLNRRIWNALEPFMEDLEVHVFLHGYECSRWVRRLANYRNGRELDRAIERSIGLQDLWQEVLYHPHQPKSYVFVSDWWRQAVNDDMRLTFPRHRVQIVHNFINADLFQYVPKEIEQRFNLLWVRSASSRTYGNDIAINVIRKLANSHYWSRCNVTIIGDGQYFSEFEDKLGDFDNVSIQRGFISQEEIANLHKNHGIFLVPTRLDSQGVSRDEAMSSGLVPVTNVVAAVPEFVDSESGIVAKPENVSELVTGILELWENPAKFQQLSKAAAQRVRYQSGFQATIEREMQILGLKD